MIYALSVAFQSQTPHLSLISWNQHFWKVVSNVRPIVWICLYICLMPLFALVYYLMPDGQFRIPQDAGTDFGSWLYYSIVTITTLGFGDYTPAHGWAQAVTAIEVMCGLIFLGFFLSLLDTASFITTMLSGEPPVNRN